MGAKSGSFYKLRVEQAKAAREGCLAAQAGLGVVPSQEDL